MKEKIKELILKVKLLLMSICLLVAIIAGFVAAAWPETKFNYPLVIAVVSALLFGAVVETL